MTKRPVRSLDDAETLRQLVRSLQEGIYITTEDGRILDANPAFLEILGFASLDEARRARVEDLIADPAEHRLQRAVVERDGGVRSYELRLRRTDGEIRTVLDTCYSARDPESGQTVFHGVLVDITHRKALEHRLEELSLRDPLTGCYNRRYLGRLRERMEAPSARFGVLVVDVDGFKSYNDRLGHQAGDEVLQRLAEFLGANVRAEDAVVRWGGDEFLLVLFRETAEAVEEVARRLQAGGAARDLPPFSIGWAAKTPGESVDQTIGRADQELLQVRAGERRSPGEGGSSGGEGSGSGRSRG